MDNTVFTHYYFSGWFIFEPRQIKTYFNNPVQKIPQWNTRYVCMRPLVSDDSNHRD